uniref:Uncharacterized protein n=1 Tax=Oncorhynchus tshawytscha TaxID=74940 RepID=A0A8C8K2Q8_ONCTS
MCSRQSVCTDWRTSLAWHCLHTASGHIHTKVLLLMYNAFVIHCFSAQTLCCITKISVVSQPLCQNLSSVERVCVTVGVHNGDVHQLGVDRPLSVAYRVQVRPMQRLEPLGSPAKLLLLSLGGDSSLDVICGALISATLIVVTYPYWETFDQLQLTSPLRALVLLDHYTTILGVSAGCSVGYWVNERLGVTFEPQGMLPVPLPALTLGGLALGSAALWWVQPVCGCCAPAMDCQSKTDARRRKEIEVLYKFTTYTFIGLVHSILVNTLFIVLGPL